MIEKYLGKLNRTTINRLFVNVKPALSDGIKKIATPIFSQKFLENLSGKQLTATELGKRALCSAQSINERIVKLGLATRQPSGNYILTTTGRLVGKDTLKTTRAGYTFSNIEWEENILVLLFSPEELAKIADKKETIKQILGK